MTYSVLMASLIYFKMTSLSLYNEEELLQGLVEGDEIIFAFIYRSYASKLIAYARKVISNKEDREEIVQEIFISLWARHYELSHVTKLDSYLFRMVKYKMIRYIQHSKVKQKYVDHFLLFESVYDAGNEGDREVDNLRATINNTLSLLPERCQKVVRLRIDEELSNDEIAMRLKIDKDSVIRYMTKALAYFKEKHPPIYKKKSVMKVEKPDARI